MNLNADNKRELDRSYRRARNTNLDQFRNAVFYLMSAIFIFFSGLSISMLVTSDWDQFAKTQIFFDFGTFVFIQLTIFSLFSTKSIKTLTSRMFKQIELFVMWLSSSIMIFGFLDPFFSATLKSFYVEIYLILLTAFIISLIYWTYKKQAIKKT
jgi:hypothetical protein